jgi:DNA-binding SARP family transcriptional activator
MLSYLLLYRKRAHSRDKLADLLWCDYPTERAKKYLRQTLWQLKSILGARDPELEALLVMDSESVAISPDVSVWLDVAWFEATFAMVENMPGYTIEACAADQLRQATSQYHGGLLEGWYRDWCLSERSRLQQLYVLMLNKLMDYAEAHHLYDAAIIYGQQVLQVDSAHEQTYQRLMCLHYLAGDRTTALRQFHRCTQALEAELSAPPAYHTIELYEHIRADLGAWLARPFSTPAPPTSMAELITQMQRLREMMLGIE